MAAGVVALRFVCLSTTTSSCRVSCVSVCAVLVSCVVCSVVSKGRSSLGNSLQWFCFVCLSVDKYTRLCLQAGSLLRNEVAGDEVFISIKGPVDAIQKMLFSFSDAFVSVPDCCFVLLFIVIFAVSLSRFRNGNNSSGSLLKDRKFPRLS